MAETNQKNIIYLEHDAEITEAIEQLKAAEGDKVRLVVPGRSGLLQSVVNLKLLKKAAQSGDKELILVTSDKTATALAGKLELAVAKNINAAPHIEAGEPEPDRTTKISADEESPNEDSGGLAAVPVQRYDAPNKKSFSIKSR
jgi:DNA polymerase IIIc chi subunit